VPVWLFREYEVEVVPCKEVTSLYALESHIFSVICKGYVLLLTMQ